VGERRGWTCARDARRRSGRRRVADDAGKVISHRGTGAIFGYGERYGGRRYWTGRSCLDDPRNTAALECGHPSAPWKPRHSRFCARPGFGFLLGGSGLSRGLPHRRAGNLRLDDLKMFVRHRIAHRSGANCRMLAERVSVPERPRAPLREPEACVLWSASVTKATALPQAIDSRASLLLAPGSGPPASSQRGRTIA
jgi:hypothetical protein